MRAEFDGLNAGRVRHAAFGGGAVEFPEIGRPRAPLLRRPIVRRVHCGRERGISAGQGDQWVGRARSRQAEREAGRIMSMVWAYILALAPSVGVGFLFYKIIRAIIEGDRNERLAQSQWEAARDAQVETGREDSVPTEPDASDHSSSGSSPTTR